MNKVFKIVLTISIGFSSWIGYNNFIAHDPKVLNIREVISPNEAIEESEEVSRSIPEARRAAKKRVQPKQSEKPVEEDPMDMAMKIGEVLLPLIAPIIAGLKRKDKKGEIKTLESDIADLAVHLGCSKAVIKGKLGLGDRRVKKTPVKKDRRKS